MNKGVARFEDKCTGHGWFGSRPNIEASENVFVNGKGAHAVGHHWASHRCGKRSHDGVLATGAARVYVNGRNLGHIDAEVSCGSLVKDGSNNVFVNPD